MDVLSDAIAVMRTGRSHSSRSDYYAPWGTRFAPSPGSGFHVVLQGSAWLLPPAGTAAQAAAEPVQLGAGDVVFLAHGRGHALASEPSAPLEDFAPGPDGYWASPAPQEPPPAERRGPRTGLLCGAYQLDRTRSHPLLAELPDVVHLPARVGAHSGLRSAVELLGAELADPQPGSYTVVSSLLDTLLLYILRAWWLHEDAERGKPAGWAAALADPPVAEALRAIHSDPARPWTVEELGRRVGLSRAAFARRFQLLVGRPPMAYLTWWRMTSAGSLLRDGDLPLRAVAERTGYASEFAFAKAFKREYGMAPGHYRTQAPALDTW
ncbi:AraC family transcriptional regulator [Streptomyces sp. NA04227]|uniref:AraC family transcriptional regulator n=1 Tax=Streptomyces sp. NA04227 TaxID=2742136 RepID=UPI0015906A9D|nr:AraC family transcriptional regulator [Streptomyces sp. NA04227]QKW09283.1 AraC family transcriptional regulator [Streptomyces sp. NA04227]